MLWTAQSGLIFDCGIRSFEGCRRMLSQHGAQTERIAAVLISHEHLDHVNRPALHVLSESGIPIFCHRRCIPSIRKRYWSDDIDEPLPVSEFSAGDFAVGQFQIHPIPLKHMDGCPVFGFAVLCPQRGRTHKIVIATDFYEYDERLVDHLTDADLVFIEANHNTRLLKKHPNPNSHFHMNNDATARLLLSVRQRSHRPPAAVMLGHLSEQRNREGLALEAVRKLFRDNGRELDFPLFAAPRYAPSEVLTVVA